MMYLTTCKPEDSLQFKFSGHGPINVKILKSTGGKVFFGIDAPATVEIQRLRGNRDEPEGDDNEREAE